MPETPAAQPGWYSDPAGTGRLRWYDGAAWTEHYQDVPSPAPTLDPGTQLPPSGMPVQAASPPDASATGGSATKKKSWLGRHKILTGLGAVVAVIIVIAAATSGGSSGDSPSADPAVTTTQDAGAAASDEDAADTGKADGSEAGIGDPVRDGKFEFTVTKVEKGVAQVGDEYLNEKAQGQFVLVHMAVENIGDEPQTFFGSNQQLSDSEGRTFNADDGAAIYLGESNALLEEINPGNTVKGIVVFDVPKDAQLASIDLHDSAFSGGVEVSLK